MLRALRDATLFTGEAMVEGHALLLKDGKILDIVANRKISSDALLISYKDKILAPGFIDLQVNGGGNVLFNNEPTAESILKIASSHARYGTTKILPTCITDKKDITLKALSAARDAMLRSKSILGIHLEGPHLGIVRRGVHKEGYIRGLDDADLELYIPAPHEVMLLTVAPETVAPEIVKILKQRGIIISLGHTDATPLQINTAIASGASGFTHLFNGMGKPGGDQTTPADTALLDQSTWCGIIMDGYHVPDTLFLLALNKKPGKIYLVSDAMAPAASNTPEPFQLYGETVICEKGRCVNQSGKLAGSSITLLDAVKNVLKTGVSLEETFRMASLYPACFIGRDEHLGKLLPGYEADINVLSPSLEISDVFIAGVKAF